MHIYKYTYIYIYIYIYISSKILGTGSVQAAAIAELSVKWSIAEDRTIKKLCQEYTENFQWINPQTLHRRRHYSCRRCRSLQSFRRYDWCGTVASSENSTPGDVQSLRVGRAENLDQLVGSNNKIPRQPVRPLRVRLRWRWRRPAALYCLQKVVAYYHGCLPRSRAWDTGETHSRGRVVAVGPAQVSRVVPHYARHENGEHWPRALFGSHAQLWGHSTGVFGGR